MECEHEKNMLSKGAWFWEGDEWTVDKDMDDRYTNQEQSRGLHSG